MSLTPISLVITAAVALLAILGNWATFPFPLWRFAAALWLLGLAYEWIVVRGTRLDARGPAGPDRLYLGRRERIDLELSGGGTRSVGIEYSPSLPPGIDGPESTRSATLPGDGSITVGIELLPRRLGNHRWSTMSARICGRLGLAWWSRPVSVGRDLRVVPDLLAATSRERVGSSAVGSSERSRRGVGDEMLALRPYRNGDPRRAVDWKASARAGRLIVRTFTQDQHLEIVVAIDAGRTSRIESDGMSRFTHYVNLTARFAEYAVLNEDRVGLIVYADRPLVALPPERGSRCVADIRRSLTEIRPQAVESDAVSAVLQLRRLVRHRSLVVLLTDLYERSASSQLAQTVRLLRPTHVPMVVGLVGQEVRELQEAHAEEWIDPYRSLAAAEYQRDINANVSRLRRMGAWAMTARPADLDREVFERYRMLRDQRRI